MKKCFLMMAMAMFAVWALASPSSACHDQRRGRCDRHGRGHACPFPVHIDPEPTQDPWQGYAIYQGPWPAGPFYSAITLDYGELNPLNRPGQDDDGYWPYPSPFVLFPSGIELNPLHLPLCTPGMNYGSGSIDGNIWQQYWVPERGCSLATFWYLINVGPEPKPGEVLPPHVYFERPYPYEGVGNYYIIYNEVVCDRDDLGAGPRTIGFWKNWDNHYNCAQIANMLQIGAECSVIFDGVTARNLSCIISNTKDMDDRARAQLLATWLNVISGKLNLALYMNVSSVPNWNLVLDPSTKGRLPVDNLLSQIENRMAAGNLSRQQWEAIKSIADAINNGLTLTK